MKSPVIIIVTFVALLSGQTARSQALFTDNFSTSGLDTTQWSQTNTASWGSVVQNGNGNVQIKGTFWDSFASIQTKSDSSAHGVFRSVRESVGKRKRSFLSAWGPPQQGFLITSRCRDARHPGSPVPATKTAPTTHRRSLWLPQT